jgi:hypothetical protein
MNLALVQVEHAPTALRRDPSFAAIPAWPLDVDSGR